MMLDSPSLASHVQIAQRFRRSVHLEADFGQPETLRGYVVSPLARDVLGRIVHGAATPGGGRAWTLVGPYGSGKSSFATLLATALASEDDNPALRLLEAHWPSMVDEVRSDLDRLGGPLVPVLVTGERTSLVHAVLRGLFDAANGYWSGRGARPHVVSALEEALDDAVAGREVPSRTVAALATEFAEKIADSAMPGAGLCLVIDELGKLLEWAAQHPKDSDVYLLQLLAEAAARADAARLVLVTVLHQSFDAYAAGLPRATRVEWSKIEGRFALVPYLEPPRHLLRLVAGALDFDGTDLPLAERHARLAADLAGAVNEDGAFEQDLVDAFPLHPTTAFCLGPLFRTRLGQNERSLFAFLASHEPLGFQEFLRRTRGDVDDQLFTIDTLYDYLVSNTMVRVSGASGERVWGAAEQALRRLPSDAHALDARVVKAVAVLNVVAKHLDLPIGIEQLRIALDATREELDGALERLQASSVLVYRKFKRSYQIWDGSDLNVAELVDQARHTVLGRGGLAAQLQELLRPYPVIASRHYIKTGTLRFLVPQFAPVPADTRSMVVGTKGDGDLYYIVPDREEELDGLVELLQQPALASFERPVVFAVPAEPRRVIEAATEYFAVVEAQRSTPELAADPVASRELEERRLLALDQLNEAVEGSYGSARAGEGTRWFYRGETVHVHRRHSAAASTIMDRAYPDAPHVLNELVNRSSLSSAAAAARREVMERMFTHGGQERLGIEGHPPELSVYLSVLAATGLHREENGRWGLGAPVEDSPFQRAWDHLDDFLAHRSGRRIPFDEFYDLLARPPVGMRDGLAPILLLVYYLVRRDSLFLYEDNSFARSPGDDIVQRMLKRPKTFELQAVDLGGSLGHVVEAVATALGLEATADAGAPALVRIIRRILSVVARLSPYATQTMRLPKSATRVRSAVKAARDPVKLVLVDLPKALDLPRLDELDSDSDLPRVFAADLQRALTDLAAADEVLLDHIEDSTARLLGAASGGTSFRADLASRAQAVEGATDMLPQVARFVGMSAALVPTDPSSRGEWLQGLATTVVGKPPHHWSDQDVPTFETTVTGLTRSFLATEQLVLELHQAHHDSVHVLRVSVLDSTGRERNRVAALRASELERMEAFKAEVLELAKRYGLSAAETMYASIASLADVLPDEDAPHHEEVGS